MSDDERHINIESDEDNANLSPSDEEGGMDSGIYSSPLDKRAHHNALERRRRDHIKDSFGHLRDSIPILKGERASRAMILKKTADYINNMENKNMGFSKEIDDLKKKNKHLQTEIQKLERQSATNLFAESTVLEAAGKISDLDESDIDEQPGKKRKLA